MTSDELLRVSGLTVKFLGESGWLTAVEDVSFSIGKKECIGLVGESGSGKSVTALSVLNLHERRTTEISGRIEYFGKNTLTLPANELRRLRGGEIAMIFQDPMSSLNPVLTVADQIIETLQLHENISHSQARRRAIELLELVRIPDAARRVDEYPHRLSGGMRQRVMIAMAIACKPKLLIADEPTTALDVTIQAEILNLLRDLQNELEMSVLLITHDLGVIAEFVQRVVVMYAGQVIEEASVMRLFDQPLHPYSQGLINAIPPLHTDMRRLLSIPGQLPDPYEIHSGCRFAARCSEHVSTCLNSQPSLIALQNGGSSRCPIRVELSGVHR